MLDLLRKRTWPPYVSGVVIGLLQLLTVFLLKQTLGASAAFMAFDEWKSFFSGSFVYSWQFWSAIGVVIGTFVSAKLGNNKGKDISPIWLQEFGYKSRGLRYLSCFFGGILLTVGAKIANGCTSGNGISGTAQLDLSSIIVLCSMFGSGILVVNIMKWAGKK